MTSASPRPRSGPLAANPRARWLLPLLLVVLVSASLLRLGDPSPGDLVELNGAALGTTWFVKVVAPEMDLAGRDALAATVAAELEGVDAKMSTWDPSSELSRFNRARSVTPIAMSPQTLEVVAIAQAVSQASGGALDVTVGPLLRAWGFGAGATAGATAPDEAELARLEMLVGFERLQLDTGASTLAKAHPEMEVDLSAVAKGYAVDRIAAALEAQGFAHFLVEVGGELAARGERHPGAPWRVAIERPQAEGRSIFAIAQLRDSAMATSGDYRDFVVRDGVRLSHLLDPRSRRPVAHTLASVSVIASTAALADAWATALSVLGPEVGPALANRLGLAAYFILREPGDTLRGVATPGFEEFLAER